MASSLLRRRISDLSVYRTLLNGTFITINLFSLLVVEGERVLKMERGHCNGERRRGKVGDEIAAEYKNVSVERR